MNKKPISFGKISFNISKAGEKSKNEANTSGFGTFGRTPIQEHKEIEEIAEDLENQHVQQVMGIKNFGKKAKNFDLDQLVEQAKINALEANKKRLEAEASKKTESKRDEESDDELIGPALPPGLTQDDDNDDDEIGPPLPPGMLNKKGCKDDKAKRAKGDQEGEDSYDELSGSDDEELPLEKRIPNSHEVRRSFFYVGWQKSRRII